MTIIFRTVMFVLLYFAWPILRKALRPDVIFLVYGTDQDKRAYWPKWAEKILRPVFPIGLIRYRSSTRKLWGLIGATLTTAEQMEKSPGLALKLLAEAKAEFPRVRAFALAGRLPGFVRRMKKTITMPFIDGTRGTRYSLVNAARALARKTGKPAGEVCIAVPGGAGYTGSQVLADLALEFIQVVALDPRYTVREGKDNILFTSDVSDLTLATVAVILTAQGDDVENLVRSFRPGAYVADDTHPPIHRLVRERLLRRGVLLSKATMANGSLRMFPRLPNFRQDDVPGCLLEALVVILNGSGTFETQEDFNRAASAAGFYCRLLRHQDDS